MVVATAGESVRMVCSELAAAPSFRCPPGYVLRWYRPGDERDWLCIHRVADVYNSFSRELFYRQFGDAAEELPSRQVYLVAPSGEAVGTATAWFDSPDRTGVGRVHWVAIKPDYQGKGLSRPLLSAVCNRMLELGDQAACLVTATGRVPALNLYYSFGFLPDIASDGVRPWLKVLENDAEGRRHALLCPGLRDWLSTLKGRAAGTLQ